MTPGGYPADNPDDTPPSGGEVLPEPEQGGETGGDNQTPPAAGTDAAAPPQDDVKGGREFEDGED